MDTTLHLPDESETRRDEVRVKDSFSSFFFLLLSACITDETPSEEMSLHEKSE